MNKPLNWILCCGVCVLTGTATAQVYPGPFSPTGRDTNQVTATREDTQSKKFCPSKDLVGAKIKDAQGNELGDIEEVLISPKEGQTFVSVELEGGRYAIVPVQALNVTPSRGAFRNAEVTLNSTKASLESGPTVAKNEWRKLDSSSFTQSIYSHYKLQAPSAMGGTADDATEENASGSSSETEREKD